MTLGTLPEGTSVLDGRTHSGDLAGLLEEMRQALQLRGEALPLDWPATAEREIREGRMFSWVIEGSSALQGIAILAVNRGRGFGQVHLRGPSSSVPEAMAFLGEIDRRKPPGLRRIDMATSADPAETERAWGGKLEAPTARLPFEVVLRHAMVRKLDPASPPPAPTLPAGYRFVPAPSLGAATLAKVDFAAFAGGPDAGMVAETPEDNERLLDGLLQGDLGSPLPEASPALVHEIGGAGTATTSRLVGFALNLAEAPRSALLADIALLPEVRGKGLGAALLARSLRGLLALGYTQSRLWVTDANTAARALYARFGYEPERVGHILRWTAPAAP